MAELRRKLAFSRASKHHASPRSEAASGSDGDEGWNRRQKRQHATAEASEAPLRQALDRICYEPCVCP